MTKSAGRRPMFDLRPAFSSVYRHALIFSIISAYSCSDR